MKINFTKAAIEQATIPANGQRVVLKDSKILGLQCRITSNGIKTFCVYRRSKNGSAERVTLGRFPSITVEQARVMAEQINASLAKGTSVAETKRQERREMSFDKLFSEYIEKHAKPNKKTWKDDVAKYNLYLKKPLGKVPFSKITKAELLGIHLDITSQYKSEDLKKPIHERRYKSGSYANRVLALVSSVFGWAMSLDLCDRNPASKIKRSKEQSRDRFLQPEEICNFLAAVEEEDNECVRDFIMLALLTGARKKNILSMRWDQISFSSNEWRIPNTKNNDPHRIPLVPEAMAILRRRRNNYDYVLPGRGVKGFMNEPRKGFLRICQRAGVANLRIHDLRRTLGSWQARTGASLVVIGKTLGHRSPQATAIYSRLDLDPVRKSVEIATQAFYKAAGIKFKFARAASQKNNGRNFFATKNCNEKFTIPFVISNRPLTLV